MIARFILDARPANEQCRLPPKPNLPPVEVLTKLSVPAGRRLFATLLDLSNYYHSVEMPSAWRSLFGLPLIIVDGVVMHPRWVTLPMGWSWSVTSAAVWDRHNASRAGSLHISLC